MKYKDCNEFKTQYPVLWKKIDILCHGLRNDKEGLLAHYYKCQNPHETKRTGNAGLQLKLGEEKFALNVAVYKTFCNSSPYYLVKDIDGLLYVKDERDQSLTKAYCPERAPYWYCTELNHKNLTASIGDYVLLEGDFTAIVSITKGCIYFNKKKPCAFCAIGDESTLKRDKDNRKSLVLSSLSIVAKDENITNFHLTGGNTLSDDRGALDYVDYVSEIKKNRKDALIAVEIPPPKPYLQKVIFEKLKEVGVDSITINIEFWNDDVRQNIMPIKGRIPKEDYISAYKMALSIFGKNKVTCGFIVGIEPIDDTKLGIVALTNIGVITEVYPFKPNTGSLMEDHLLTNVNDIVEVSLFANHNMLVNGLSAEQSSGCVKCGACGLTQQLINI